MSSMTVRFNTARLAARLDGVATAAADAVRPAAQAGAQIYYDEMRARAPQSPAGTAHIFTSKRRKDGSVGQKYLFYSGDLKRAIYQKYADDRSGAGRALYVVSWRKSGPGAVPYAHMVEHGTSKMAARPFLRPAYDAMRADARDAVLARLRESVRGALP